MSRARNVAIPSPAEYLQVLDTAWQDALVPRASDAPTVISLFAGGGGSSLGYRMAGYRELLATDWDARAIETLERNLSDVPTWQGNIASLAVTQLQEMTGLIPGELDVLDGSPPCQGFSTAGTRHFTDARNGLFQEYVRILTALQPRAFVMENVAGMVRGKMRLVFVDCLRALKEAGYRVSARVLNAMYFGVPQQRQRLIFIGVRHDLEAEPSHPAAISWPISLRTALAAATLVGEQDEDAPTPALSDSYGQLWPHVRPGQRAMDVIGKGYASCVKPHPDRPCVTLMKTQKGTGFATIVHPAEQRALSIREAATISTYPPAFRFVGTYQEQWARIGNSVPPLLMQAIADHLQKHVLVDNPVAILSGPSWRSA